MENENQFDVKSVIIVVLLVVLAICCVQLAKTQARLTQAEKIIATWNQSGENWITHGRITDPGSVPQGPALTNN